MSEQNNIFSLMALLGVTAAVVVVFAIPWRMAMPVADVMHRPGLNIPQMTGPQAAHMNEIRTRFEQGIALLHARQYEYAITALDRVIRLSPTMPEAHVNMGFALLGLKEYDLAAASFDKAMTYNVNQANAYYGLGLAWAAKGDYAGALGAMRSYLHLVKDGGSYVKRARELLAEWQKSLPRNIETPQPKPDEEKSGH